MRGKDSSNRGKATGNNQLVRQKDEREAQHERQRNDSKAAMAAMVAATAAAATVTLVAAAAAKTAVATTIAGGTSINQLKVVMEETVAVQQRW
jgi:hypothetical protein